jgi:hypothetical protein
MNGTFIPAENQRIAFAANFEKIALGNIYENGSMKKFEVTSLDENFVILTTLDNDGSLTSLRKKFDKEAFSKLITNKYFALAKIRKYVAYSDLRSKYEINSLFIK